MNYYIADLHLFHNNVTKAGKDFDNRPFADLDEMHRVIRQNWNNHVRKNDTVYILGDFAYKGNATKVAEYAAKLNGNKILIRGNHDRAGNPEYRAQFQEICDYKEITDTLGGNSVHLVLSHYPILAWNRQHRGAILLYGHVHNSPEDAFFQKCLREFSDTMGEDVKLQAYNVGCMQPHMDYTPRTIEEIVNIG